MESNFNGRGSERAVNNGEIGVGNCVNFIVDRWKYADAALESTFAIGLANQLNFHPALSRRKLDFILCMLRSHPLGGADHGDDAVDIQKSQREAHKGSNLPQSIDVA